MQITTTVRFSLRPMQNVDCIVYRTIYYKRDKQIKKIYTLVGLPGLSTIILFKPQLLRILIKKLLFCRWLVVRISGNTRWKDPTDGRAQTVNGPDNGRCASG